MEDEILEEIYSSEGQGQSALEEIMAQALLIELVNEKKAEVFENVVFSGTRRYYIEDLTQRDYLLEGTTPYQFEVMGNVIEESSWGVLLCKVANLLLKLYPDYIEKIPAFRCQWTKAAMFSLESKTNYKPIDYGIYLNCNHTALHSCWFLQDLLDFFGIDKGAVHFLIHRPCSVEPKNVKAYIEKRFKRGFADYICSKHKKGMDYAEKVIQNIEKYLNPMLLKISRSYTNFFLFDSNTILYSYVKKIRELIASKPYVDKVKKGLNKYLDYIVEYYKS